MVLKGRLGLQSVQNPHVDRHGLIWLKRGRLMVEDGNLVFSTAGFDNLDSGSYDIPYQTISNVLLGPGGTVSHDALRLLARQDTGLLAVGADGVRLYAVSMPSGPDRSDLARQHARLWGDEASRTDVARRMYALRLGDDLPAHSRDLDSLRGMEGTRMKQIYQTLADQYGIEWNGRNYDRNDPASNDVANNALNHAVTAVYASARVAVAVSGAIPQLGFIHEDSGHAFALDVADLFRTSITIPVAFRAVKRFEERGAKNVESTTRKLAGNTLREESVINDMIDRIHDLLDEEATESEEAS